MKIFRKLYPFFLAVICFNIIRLVTDIPNQNPFWAGGIHRHLIALLFLTLIFYLYDFLIHKSIEKRWFVRRNRFDIVKEYAAVILFQLVCGNLLFYLSVQTGILYLGSPVKDFIIANVVIIPIFTLYYTAVNREKIETDYREQALLVEKIKVSELENELKMLRSQYHPHFLFNALNTVYFQVSRENNAAKQTIELLSDLLRYQLYNINQEVTLEQEINYMQTYIEFQKQRMTDSLQLRFDLNIHNVKLNIHPLLFQPLLENAFKYVGGAYRIDIAMKQSKDNLIFHISNSIPEGETAHSKKGGIGLANLKRRLDLLYPDKHLLNIKQEEKSFVVELILN